MAAAEGLRRAVKGLSEAEFRERFGTEEACRAALFEMRWREGLTCPTRCGHKGFCALRTRELFQCNRCKRQLRLTAGTVFQDTKLPLTTWFAAIYHLTQGKGGISSIELGRRLGVKRQTAWLRKHKLMRVTRPPETGPRIRRICSTFVREEDRCARAGSRTSRSSRSSGSTRRGRSSRSSAAGTTSRRPLST